MKWIYVAMLVVLAPGAVRPHTQTMHQYLVMQGYTLLRNRLGPIPFMDARIGGMETFFAGDYEWQRGFVTTGAWREDEEDVVFGYRDYSASWLPPRAGDKALISITHFWNADNGDYADNVFRVTWMGATGTIGPYPNAYKKMMYYANGNWLVVFPYAMRVQKLNGDWLQLIPVSTAPALSYASLADVWRTGRMHTQWIGSYLMYNERTGRNEWYDGRVILDDATKNALVWEVLGRMCHLLGDLSVPAHAHGGEHKDGDLYEGWVGSDQKGSPYTCWNGNNVGAFINPYGHGTDPLHYLMYTMQQMADHFGANGPHGGDGNDDIKGSFSQAEYNFLNGLPLSSLGVPTSMAGPFDDSHLANVRDRLEPYSLRVMAGLLYWFACEAGLWPPPPALISPANGASHVPAGTAFSWQPLTGTTAYHIQLSPSADFSSDVLDFSGLASTTFRPPTGLAFLTRYYWHVCGLNDAGNGMWSETRSLTTAPAPLCVSINGPTRLAPYQLGTWTAAVRGGVSPYQYLWSTIRECAGASLSPCQTPQMLPPCGIWMAMGGDGPSVQKNDASTFQIRCTATDAVGCSTTSSALEVAVGSSNIAGIGGSADSRVSVGSSGLPGRFALEGAYPNPFNPSTEVRFALPMAARVSLSVYDLLGTEVARLVDGFRPAGRYAVTWNGTSRSGAPAGTGMYFARLKATDEAGVLRFTNTGRLILLR